MKSGIFSRASFRARSVRAGGANPPARMLRALTALMLLATFGPGLTADEYTIPAEAKDHWAWKPPVRPAIPRVRDAGWVRNPIDAFILAKLEAAGLAPAAPASREQLLR